MRHMPAASVFHFALKRNAIEAMCKRYCVIHRVSLLMYARLAKDGFIGYIGLELWKPCAELPSCLPRYVCNSRPFSHGNISRPVAQGGRT
jgi:hypothetical protein